MPEFTRPLLIVCVACAFSLAACDKHDHDHENGHDAQPATAHDDHDGHDHDDDHDDHDHDDDHAHGDDHDHDDHGHAHDDHDAHDHGDAHDDHDHSHGPAHTHNLSIGDVVLAMTIEGEPHPGVEIHVEARYVSGSIPEDIRLWFGPKSGEGAMKVLAHVHDDHWHAHVECPGTITHQDSLWVEIHGADGERVAKSIKLH